MSSAQITRAVAGGRLSFGGSRDPSACRAEQQRAMGGAALCQPLYQVDVVVPVRVVRCAVAFLAAEAGVETACLERVGAQRHLAAAVARGPGWSALATFSHWSKTRSGAGADRSRTLD